MLEIYITGRYPPVVHLKSNCFGIIGKPRIVNAGLTNKELETILSNCEPCCICASSYTGNKEERRKELEKLSET